MGSQPARRHSGYGGGGDPDRASPNPTGTDLRRNLGCGRGRAASRAWELVCPALAPLPTIYRGVGGLGAQP
jgi:hypothetical protein